MAANIGKSVRHNDLAQIHIAKKDLLLDDDTYRKMLFTVARVNSARDLDFAGRKQVLEHMKARGWKPKQHVPARTARARADDPQSRKIRALWIELHKAGKVDDPSEDALAAFVKRQTGVDALQWAAKAQKGAVIEALKAWQLR